MYKLLSWLLYFVLIFGTIAPLLFMQHGITDTAVRSDCKHDVIYLDDEAIALSDMSNGSSSLRSEAIKAYNIVNDMRSDAGLNPLSWDGNLESTSDVRSIEASESFSHIRPNGKNWYTVNSQIQGGENLAFGFSDAGSAVNAWMNSPTHKENILWPEFNTMAISVYVTDDGVYYWAQEFGY